MPGCRDRLEAAAIRPHTSYNEFPRQIFARPCGQIANDRLISSGAGLFIGPLWEVGDATAYAFSLTFYTALLRGATIAQATRQGRTAARRQGDPTWLAYSVYGHPNATVVTV